MHNSGGGKYGVFLLLNGSPSFHFGVYSNLAVNERPGAAVVWLLADLGSFTVVLMKFFHFAEKNLAELQCFDMQMCKAIVMY